MDILQYVSEGAMIMVAVQLVLGQVIKKIPRVPDWTIPFVLLIPGVLGCMAMGGWTVQSALQGVLVTGMAVYGNQIWKQAMGHDESVADEDSTESE